MTTFRIRPLGHGWSTIAAPDGADEREQLLAAFGNALQSVPELRSLSPDPDAYELVWTRSRLSAYHQTVEDRAAFHAEPSTR